MKAVLFLIDDYQTLAYIAEEFFKKNVVFTVSLDTTNTPQMRFPVPGECSRTSFYKWVYNNDIKTYIDDGMKRRVKLVAFCSNRIPAVIRKAQSLLAADYFCRGVYSLDFGAACDGPIPYGELNLSDNVVSEVQKA